MILAELWLSLQSIRQPLVRSAVIRFSINFVLKSPAALGHRAPNRSYFSPDPIDGLATRRPRPSCWPLSKTSSPPQRPDNDVAHSSAAGLPSKRHLSRAPTRPVS